MARLKAVPTMEPPSFQDIELSFDSDAWERKHPGDKHPGFYFRFAEDDSLFDDFNEKGRDSRALLYTRLARACELQGVINRTQEEIKCIWGRLLCEGYDDDAIKAVKGVFARLKKTDDIQDAVETEKLQLNGVSRMARALRLEERFEMQRMKDEGLKRA